MISDWIKVNVMKYASWFVIFLLFASPMLSNATTIAKCGGTEGNTYWHNSAGNTENKSEWKKDKISSSTTLISTAKGDYDILVVDKFGNVSSFVQDGGQVLLLRKGSEDATFIHVHQYMAIELYTFWKSRNGDSNFDLLLSKGGDKMLFHFSALMTGKCDYIDFDLIR